jgi:2-isopropylmalate synthase
MILHVHKNHTPVFTDIATKQITRTSQLVAACTGMHVQPNKAIVGSNAFAHESGIHQDGMLKHAATYEIMDPEVIGLGSTQLVLGKHSGRHAFNKRLAELGYDNLSESELQSVFTRFKRLADTKKVVSESDLHALLADEVTKSPEKFKMTALQVQSGMGLINTATVTICNLEGESWTDAAIGNGPVDSVFQAIERIIGCPPMTLTEFDIKAITPGTDAQGSVTVRIRETNDTGRDNPAGGLRSFRSFMGHGTDTDIIQASGKAYLDAINRYLSWVKKE